MIIPLFPWSTRDIFIPHGGETAVRKIRVLERAEK